MKDRPINVLLLGKNPPNEITIMEFMPEIKVPIERSDIYSPFPTILNLETLSKPIDYEIWSFYQYDKNRNVYVYRLKGYG